MITAVLICLAAIFKAVADTIAHHKERSIFAKSRFWSNGTGKHLPFTKYPFDGWHIANSLMIASFIAGCVLHRPLLTWFVEIPVYGAGFIAVFNLFYNKILLK
jgi:hypothetical protein